MHLGILDPEYLVGLGYVVLFGIVFAESGLFFGFFLPGDSLLLTAGLFAYKGHLDLQVLLPTLFVAAVLGDNVGYWFGRKVGPPLFAREEVMAGLRHLAPYRESTLLVTNLRPALIPPEKRATARRVREYDDALAFIRELAAARTAPRANLQLLFL